MDQDHSYSWFYKVNKDSTLSYFKKKYFDNVRGMLKVWFGTEKNGVFNKGLYYMYCECHPTLVHQQQRKTYVKVGFCVYSHKSFDIKMKNKYDIEFMRK